MSRIFKYAAVTATVSLLLCTSCKGRTSSDVEADGETVEVVIPEQTPDTIYTQMPEATDSINR